MAQLVATSYLDLVAVMACCLEESEPANSGMACCKVKVRDCHYPV